MATMVAIPFGLRYWKRTSWAASGGATQNVTLDFSPITNAFAL